MSLTNEEQKLMKTMNGSMAVIMGYLKMERGKIPPSDVTKIAKELGLVEKRVSKSDLIGYKNEIETDVELRVLFDKTINREIKLNDLRSIWDEDNVVEEEKLMDLTTNFIVDKEQNNAKLREMRKLQREGAYMDIMLNEMKKQLSHELKDLPTPKYIKSVNGSEDREASMILVFGDWHIGALVYNKDTGGYNFEKLQSSIYDIIEYATGIIESRGVTDIHCYHVGDLIEHINMRNVDQAFDAEFPATEQQTKGIRFTVDVLNELSKLAPVTFGAVGGNHDRFTGNKNDKIYNDNVAYILIDMLLFIQNDLGQLPNVEIIDNRDDVYSLHTEVAGKHIKVVHGDHEKKNNSVKIPTHIKDRPIDMLIMGHIHTSRMIQEDYGRFHVYNGSPMGANTFSKELNLPTTFGSQSIIVLEEGVMTPTFIPVMLHDGKLA